MDYALMGFNLFFRSNEMNATDFGHCHLDRQCNIWCINNNNHNYVTSDSYDYDMIEQRTPIIAQNQPAYYFFSLIAEFKQLQNTVFVWEIYLFVYNKSSG